jgi:RNA polymerase sigma-70 factor (ECF subfamily)
VVIPYFFKKECNNDIYFIDCNKEDLKTPESIAYMKENDLIKDLQTQIAFCDDMKAYRQLYEMLFDRLFNFSFSFVKSKEVAEEIVSDVFIKLWNIRSRLHDIDNLAVYLYTIAKNFSLNYITHHHKHPKVSLDDISFELATTVSPEELYITSEMAARINEIINQLPSKCKVIFQLVREDGLKYKEVASILNISELTVRNQLAIAARKITQAIQPTLVEIPLAKRSEN